MNIHDAIANGNKILKKNNIKSAQLDSEVLMSEAIKRIANSNSVSDLFN